MTNGKMLRDALDDVIPQQTMNEDGTFSVMSNGDTSEVNFRKYRLLRDSADEVIPQQYFDTEQDKFVPGVIGGGYDGELPDASNSRKGIVQLENSLESASTTRAATPALVKQVDDKVTTVTAQLEQTTDAIVEHFTNTNLKHIEVVDEIPANLVGKGIFFTKQEGTSSAPNKPTIQDLTERVEFLEENGVGGDNTLRGLIANNTSVNNRSVLEQAFGDANLDTIILPSGAFTTTRINTSINNKVIKGVPAKTILQSTDTELLFFWDSENVVFEDITFSSSSPEEWNGVITASNSALKNITFKRCKFTSNGSNGVKIVNEGSKTSDFITFESCTFENIGRMGVEFQNHNDTTRAYRYSNITFKDCIFKNIGTVDNGMGISMSGVGKSVTVQNCKFIDCWQIGFENIGANYVTIDNNEFIGETKSFSPINVTNERPNDYISITNNKSSGVLGGINLYNGKDMIFSNNQFYGIYTVYIRNITDSKFTNNIITASGGEALFFDNSHHNEIWGNTLDTRISDSNRTVCKFYGSGSTNNKMYNNQLYRANGGVWIASTDGAGNNDVGYNYHENNKVNGYEQTFSTAIFEDNQWTVNGATSLTIEFATATWWYPFYLDISVYGVEGGGSNMFAVSSKVFGRVMSSLEFTKTDVITSNDATITVSKNGNKITLTCTHTSMNNTTHRWIVNATADLPMHLE